MKTSLPRALRHSFEASLGTDLRAVRIRTGAFANVVCRTARAEAVTVGQTLFFAEGMFDPDSSAGCTRIAHELIHVAQSGAGFPGAFLSRDDEPAECEAYALAPRVACGERVAIRGRRRAWIHAVFSYAQKQAALAIDLAAGRKPAPRYLEAFGGVEKMFDFRQQIGSGTLQTLVANYYPDLLLDLKKDLSTAELQFLAGLSANALQGLRSISIDWQKKILRVLRDTAPVATAVMALPGGGVAVPPATPGLPAPLSQTTQYVALANTVITERDDNNDATRNLIFNALGVCVAEVNFDNHGGTAVSGHLHPYPVWSMPITGHHISGTPHIDMADYPALWRALPIGVNPRTALGT